MDKLFEQLHDSVQAKDYNKISDVLDDMSNKLQLDMSEMDKDEKLNVCLTLLKSMLIVVEHISVKWSDELFKRKNDE